MEGFGRLPNPPDVSLAVILKQRAEAGVVANMHLVGNVEGCDCIIVDDMIDSAGTTRPRGPRTALPRRSTDPPPLERARETTRRWPHAPSGTSPSLAHCPLSRACAC